MKLLIVSPCQGSYGGIEAFVFALAAEARHSGFDVRICFKKTRDFRFTGNLEKMTQASGATFCGRRSIELARQILWADVVHAQNAPPDVILLAKLLRKPLALTIHNYMARPMTLHRLLWKWGARIADARWYNSSFVWNTWEPRTKLRGSRKVPTVSILPQQVAPIEKRRGFAFIGRWIPNKGVDTLVHAYAAADLDRSAWPLVLMGDGPLRPFVEEQIRQRRIDHIEIAGFVDEETKANRMRCARWVVVPPNTREDFGLTAVEARSVGVPCIITRDGGLPEAGGTQALECEPGDAASLTSALEKAARMTDDEYRERATKTREDLSNELVPMEFYSRAYRQLFCRTAVD